MKQLLSRINLKKFLIRLLPYLIIAYFFDKISWLYRLTPQDQILYKLIYTISNIQYAFHSFLPSFHPIDLLFGVACGAAFRIALYVRSKNAKKFRPGNEFGSARWGTAEDIKPYVDPVFENNIILTQTERLTMSSRPKQPKYARNKNILIVGGSGSGKTRFFIKPSLMQCTSKKYPTSFIVTDPKGTLLVECGQMLVDEGYTVKSLNTINFSKSMRYNPFMYIRSEKDILKLVNTIIANTKGEGEKSNEDFWVKAERLYYCALIGYIWYEAPVEEQNFNTLLEFINASETREDDENFKNAVDLLFEELEQKKPEHFAVRQYKKYKLAAGKTAKSILISCGARLAPFDIKELRDLTAYDEMNEDFHMAIAEGSGNPVYVKLMGSINEMMKNNMWKFGKQRSNSVLNALNVFIDRLEMLHRGSRLALLLFEKGSTQCLQRGFVYLEFSESK